MMNSYYRARQEDRRKWFFDGTRTASMSIKPKRPGNMKFCYFYRFVDSVFFLLNIVFVARSTFIRFGSLHKTLNFIAVNYFDKIHAKLATFFSLPLLTIDSTLCNISCEYQQIV